MKNRKGNLLMTLGLVLILAALALVGYNCLLYTSPSPRD